MPSPVHPDREPLLKAIDEIRQRPGLTPEADALLRLAQESTQGRPLSEIIEEAHELKALEQQHKALFMEWVKLCASNRELLAQYDRLRGTNLSLHGAPMDLLIDQATGRLEADALGFFEFCQDLFLRIDPESLFARKN